MNVGIGIVRTKAMAVLLGPAGVGLMGLYNQIVEMTQTIAGMGINSSGVRQIAEAVGSGETERIARTVTVLRRMSVLLGTVGALLLVIFAKPVSRLTFGGVEQASGVVLLSLAVLFRSVSLGQGALIQGMRRIADLAKMGVLGALLGTVISIPLVFYLGERGVVPALVGVAGMAVLTSWYYSRKVQIRAPSMALSDLLHEASALLKLGLAFMGSALLTVGAAYAVRIIVLHRIGLDGAGFYQSAWALGGLYIGFILQAMGADFYPRLTAAASDNPECNRLVNEQALVGLLLAGPGVIATLTLAPLVLTVFYTAKFLAAVDVLRWLCMGLMLRVVAWPMGFILLAKNEQLIFFATEVAATLVHVGCTWVLISHFGLAGAGMAFFGLYVWHGFLLYVIVRKLSGFRWSAANRKVAMIYLPTIALVFCGCHWLPAWAATTLGLGAALLIGFYSLRVLLKLVPWRRIPKPLQRFLIRLGCAPTESDASPDR